MAKKNRYWFIDNSTLTLRMGIVERATNATTKDGFSSNYTSITEAKDITVDAIIRDTDLAVGALTATWSQIPEQFHEAMVYKAISEGYKKSKGFNLERAQFFNAEYRSILKEAKKYSRSNYTTTGFIRPQEF
jgi:hypothetical protein|tara:strand:+ start:2963 stop:3358 length:396 start_codon:yes stop_codon:yes gene_type:complete